MAKAFECDRCKEMFHGDPYANGRLVPHDKLPLKEFEFEGCESCFKAIDRFIASPPAKGSER